MEQGGFWTTGVSYKQVFTKWCDDTKNILLYVRHVEEVFRVYVSGCILLKVTVERACCKAETWVDFW